MILEFFILVLLYYYAVRIDKCRSGVPYRGFMKDVLYDLAASGGKSFKFIPVLVSVHQSDSHDLKLLIKWRNLLVVLFWLITISLFIFGIING
jgi:hypothetical protein